MNINSEKENLFSLLAQPQLNSPYLSPLIGNDNSKEFQEHQQLEDFQLDQAQVNQEHYSYQQQGDHDFNLLADHKSTLEADLIQDNVPNSTSNKKPFFCVEKNDSTKIYCIINFLIQNDELPENDIKSAGQYLYKGSNILQYIFITMITKFKKLHKTKQQMTKFCMRKAFKYVNDQHPHNKKKHKNQKQDGNEQNFNFQMPFRKNSTQKTMNAQFLKQVFKNPVFVEGYQNFLQDFKDIIGKDNQYKIKYLSETIQQYLSSDNIKKIADIKRLPWTRSILTKTQKLAFNLLKYVDQKQDHIEFDKQ